MATRTILQLDLFGGPARPHVPEPIFTPEAPPPARVPVLPGQLDLLAARAVRLAPVAQALAEGRFLDALQAVRDLPGEELLAAALDRLVSAADDGALPVLEPVAPTSVVAAARRGLARVRARNAEAAGHLLDAAQAWRDARQPEDARRVLQRAVSSGEQAGEALVHLGNLEWEEGPPERARAHYQHAAWRDPDGVNPDDIMDPAVRALFRDAREVVPGAVTPWVPLVGFALGTWPLGPCQAQDPQAPAARFHAALVRSRAGRRAGQPDVAARREMKTLAPALLALLLEEGRA